MLDMGPLQARNAPLTKRGFLFAARPSSRRGSSRREHPAVEPRFGGASFSRCPRRASLPPAGTSARPSAADGEASREGEKGRRPEDEDGGRRDGDGNGALEPSASAGTAGKGEALPAGAPSQTRAERRPEAPLPWTPEQRNAGRRPEAHAPGRLAVYGFHGDDLAGQQARLLPDFHPGSLRLRQVGEAVDTQALKADMPEAKTTEFVSVAQPETVIFCDASDAFAKVMVVPRRLEVTSASTRPLKTIDMVPDMAAKVSCPQFSEPQTAQSLPQFPVIESFPPPDRHSPQRVKAECRH